MSSAFMAIYMGETLEHALFCALWGFITTAIIMCLWWFWTWRK